MPNLLTPTEIAERLRVNIRTVYNWLRAGKLPAAKKFGGVWRVDESELNTLTRDGSEPTHNR